jgi:outer membrane protein assembly factor BamB
MTSFDARTGEARWTADLRAGGVSAPAVSRGPAGSAVAVAVDDDLAAKAFDLVDGRPRWTVPVGAAGSPEVPPLPLADGRVLVADRLAGLTLIDGNGKRAWNARVEGAAIRGGPVGPTIDGRYALPLVDGQFFVAGPDRSTRTVRPPGGVANGVAVAPGGRLYVSTARGPANQLAAYT